MHQQDTQRQTDILSLASTLTPQRREIILALIKLLAEGKNSTPLLSEQERTEARAIVLPELERLRAEGHPQTELEKILTRERETDPTAEHLSRV